MAPLAISSASVIAMRTLLLWPATGRHTAWQRREGARMVAEKVDAVRESQTEALALAWRLCWMPWTVYGPLAGRSLHEAGVAAAESIAAPFSRRAAGNARRLQARVDASVPPVAALVPALVPARRSRRRPA